MRCSLEACLWHGDSRAAVVLETSPVLRVAAYSDEYDGVAIVEYDAALAWTYGLRVGDPLVAVFMYWDVGGDVDSRVRRGPYGTPRVWHGVAPIIAQFCTNDHEQLDVLVSRIPPAEFDRAWSLGVEALRSQPDNRFDGRPSRLLHDGSFWAAEHEMRWLATGISMVTAAALTVGVLPALAVFAAAGVSFLGAHIFVQRPLPSRPQVREG